MSMKDVQNNHEFESEYASTYNTLLFVDPELEYLNRDIYGVIIDKTNLEVTPMSVNDLCFCGSGKKQKKCHPDIHPDSVAAQLLRIYYKLDMEISGIKDTVCQKGCSDCCTDDFEISIAEFMMILRYLNIKFSREQIDKIIASSKNGMISLGGKCVLLNSDNNSCSIYEVRPIVCRKYGYYQATTDCNKVLDSLSSDSLLKTTFDSGGGIHYFRYGEKIIETMQKTIVYWFSKCDGEKLTVDKLNKLYYTFYNRPINEYIKTMLL